MPSALLTLNNASELIVQLLAKSAWYWPKIMRVRIMNNVKSVNDKELSMITDGYVLFHQYLISCYTDLLDPYSNS